MISHVEMPPVETDVFRARLFWLGRTPLTVGAGYLMKLATRQVRVTVDRIEKVIDAGSLAGADQGDQPQVVERNAVAEVVLRSRGLLALDEFRDLPNTGRFVLIEDYDTVGGGIIAMDGYPDQRSAVTRKSTNITAVEHRVTAEARARRNGHTGGVLWLTGLSGAGKSTLAIELEQRLFAKGYQVFVLDGDNVRHGLNANLGFSPEDRTENIRRVGEVAALFAEAGFLVLTAFISPYRADRERARSAAGAGFHEVHVRADLDVCEGRDPKGLYAKARRGEIRDFTGIDAPYEPPAAPELVVDTGRLSIEEAVQSVMDYIERRFAIAR
ncbi:NodQ bifunctional enzyme [Tistrella mobilis KA081020-065]|uniref:Adenylyl-sulfate kinase n=2 Tax=Tistrella mobilis TaxID=171437 RepID=I3TID9_TISMK|nr:NodQ bifunctional enzyme [Tistrella mobilis KA081020-065]